MFIARSMPNSPEWKKKVYFLILLGLIGCLRVFFSIHLFVGVICGGGFMLPLYYLSRFP